MNFNPTTSRRWMAALCAIAMLASPADAQRKKQKKSKYDAAYWATDPYTKNDEAAMKRAGYVSFGPLTWGDDHGSNDIKSMFQQTNLLFVETAHFKIGSSLPEYTLPKGKKLEKKILRAELTRLQKIFPEIKPTRRKLDPWLRLHLFALRLEETYAEYSEKINVTDADFPKSSKKRVAGAATQTRYMGQGPYLGMRAKFLVLLMRKGGNMTRYGARARGGMKTTGGPKPQRHYFLEVGSLFFGTSCECADNGLYNDHALHCHVVFNTVQAMVDGYKDFFFAAPVWLREGLSHWFLRRIDPKEHCFTGIKGRSGTKRYDPKWDVKIKKRVKHSDFTPAAKVMKYMAFDDLTFGDHMAIWSRIDFLLSLGDDKFARFMSILKDPIVVRPGEIPEDEKIWAQQDRALQQAFGFDAARLDENWREFVLKSYPHK